MCYRIATPKLSEVVEQEFQAKLEAPELYIPFHHLNGFSGQSVPLVTVEDPTVIKMVPWQNPLEFNSLNARSEEIFQPKKYFSKFATKRAILAVSGFYESFEKPKFNKKTGLPLKAGDKYPYFITLDGKECFGIGCLISPMNTVSILTTDANELMAQIHNIALRMPLILHREDYGKWLSQDLSKEEQSVLMRPYEATAMNAHPISKLIYSKTENSNVPEASVRFKYDEELAVFRHGVAIQEQ